MDSITGGHAGQKAAPLDRQAIVLVAICSLTYFLDALVHSVMGPLAPGIARTLHLSRAELGPIFSANLFGQCFGLVLVPLLVPRFGHRRVMVAMMIGFGLAQAATGLAAGRDSLIALRIVTGFFLGGALPSGMALVAANTPASRRGLAISVLFTGYSFGAVIAGVIASLFTGDDAWRSAMAIIAAACIASALIAWRWLADASASQPSRNHPDEGSRTTILSRRYLLGTLMLWVIFVSLLTINYCLNSWLPTLLTDVGRDAAFAALSVSIFGAGGLVATMAVGPLIDRLGTMPVLVTSLVLAMLTLFLIGRNIESASPATLLALLTAGGFFSLGAYGGVNVILADFYPDRLRAIGVGWTKSVGRFGTVIAPILIGLGLSAGVSQETVMSLFAVPAGLALLGLIGVATSMRRQAA